MRLSPKTFTATAARIASSFSLLLLVAVAWAGTYTDLNTRMERAKTVTEVKAAIKGALHPAPNRVSNGDELLQFLDAEGTDASEQLPRIRKIVATRALAEKVPSVKSAGAQATDIKRSPLYRDAGERQSSNWLGRALESLSKLKWNLDTPKGPDAPDLDFLGRWMRYLAWTLLAAAVIAFGWFAIKHINWKAGLKRKAKALLEEDEPERTLDEWLAQADLLASQGRHREAVRALYLACLLRLDEAGVARFDRGQTNWEHLERIKASPRFPVGVDFDTPTRQFDRIWYGKICRGIEDVDLFRSWYTSITDSLKAKAA